jgi:hypothetical protein
MKKAISYLYREILLEVKEELDRLYRSTYEEDQEYKYSIEQFRLKYDAFNLEDVDNFDEDKLQEFYEELNYGEWEEIVRDVIYGFRYSGENADDKVYEDRYYCYREVCKKITGSDDFSKRGSSELYLGWTYYFGGGKHSQPEEVEWMEDCYLLKVREVEETRVVKVYERVENE